MPSPTIFLSHISEEKDLAMKLKALIEEKFLGMMTVFVSSDENSIQMGQRWLDSITGALAHCVVEVILCSPMSVGRPWINFEAGSGWIRGIPVIPLCHSGMSVTNLPLPLNMLEASVLTNSQDLRRLFSVLAQSIGSHNPSIDFTGFINDVRELEESYTFWSRLKEHIRVLDAINPAILNALRTQPSSVTVDLTETQLNTLNILLQFFRSHKILEAQLTGATKIGPGVRHECSFRKLESFESVRDPRALI